MVAWDGCDGADEEGPDRSLWVVCRCRRGKVLIGFVAEGGIDALSSHVAEEVDNERGHDLNCVGMPLMGATVRVQGLSPYPDWAWDCLQLACRCGRWSPMLGEVCIRWLF